MQSGDSRPKHVVDLVRVLYGEAILERLLDLQQYHVLLHSRNENVDEDEIFV